MEGILKRLLLQAVEPLRASSTNLVFIRRIHSLVDLLFTLEYIRFLHNLTARQNVNPALGTTAIYGLP